MKWLMLHFNAETARETIHLHFGTTGVERRTLNKLWDLKCFLSAATVWSGIKKKVISIYLAIVLIFSIQHFFIIHYTVNKYCMLIGEI